MRIEELLANTGHTVSELHTTEWHAVQYFLDPDLVCRIQNKRYRVELIITETLSIDKS